MNWRVIGDVEWGRGPISPQTVCEVARKHKKRIIQIGFQRSWLLWWGPGQSPGGVWGSALKKINLFCRTVDADPRKQGDSGGSV